MHFFIVAEHMEVGVGACCICRHEAKERWLGRISLKPDAYSFGKDKLKEAPHIFFIAVQGE